MYTVTTKHGTEYEIHYALKRKGSPKNDLVAPDIDRIIHYLCDAHRCKADEIVIYEAADNRETR